MNLHGLLVLCTFVLLCITNSHRAKANTPQQLMVDDIDSLDMVIFDLDKVIIGGEFIEIPVYIFSDDLINTLDFSMFINTENLEYESIVDHTGEMQFAAYLNPNDLKLRFTSNSFSPYPVGNFKVISIRFKVLSPVFYVTDMTMLTAYLNGDPCTTELLGSDFNVAINEIIRDEVFVSPNPASDLIYVKTHQGGRLDILDMQGKRVLDSRIILADMINPIEIDRLPHGQYTVSILTDDLKLKVQQIVVQ